MSCIKYGCEYLNSKSLLRCADHLKDEIKDYYNYYLVGDAENNNFPHFINVKWNHLTP